jgi:ribose 5-phosphate isomerase A
MSDDPEVGKINAAAAALDLVEDGMTLGLGTGSTATHFVRMLGTRVRTGLKVRGVPTSEATRLLAEENGVPLVEAEKVGRIQLAVDGADESDRELRLIKGGGAALLREKIIASAAEQFVVIVDESKVVDQLGAFPLPVEVVPFAFPLTAQRVFEALKASGCAKRDVDLRERNGRAVVTDSGNYILDCRCAQIPHPAKLAKVLKSITGVVEHGLFLGMARTLIIGKARGAEVLERS